MKKFLSLIFCVMVLIGSLSMTGNAAGELSLGASSHQVSRGDTLTVVISISENPGIAGLTINISYDEACLTYINSEIAMGGGLTTLPQTGSSPLTFGWMSGTEDSTYTGTFASITFQVKDTAPIGTTNISISVDSGNATNAAMEDIACVFSAGTITIVCEHTYGAWEKSGETQHKRVCSKCSDVEYASHTWDAGKVTAEPTCKDTGIKTYTCTACGETKTEVVPVTDEHTWGDDWEKVDEASHKHTCSVCGKEETAAHTWQEGEATKAPTCKETGIRVDTCVCGATKEITLPVTEEHTWGSWEKDDAANHRHTCSVCGKEETAAHTWDTGKVTTEPTCKDTGIKTYACTVCGATKTEAIPTTDKHTWGAWEIVDETQHKHTCGLCGKEELNDHTWDGGVVTVEPSGGKEGEKTLTCTACGATKTEEIPATHEHSYSTEWSYDDTMHGHICSCGSKKGTQSHTWNERVVQKEATCTEPGTVLYICTVCGAAKSESVSAEHTPGEWTVVTEASCTEAGKQEQRCTVCGVILKEMTIEAKGHTAGAWEEEAGERVQKCTVCGEILVREPIQTETTEAIQTTQPTESTEPTDTTAPGGDSGDGFPIALIVILIAAGVAVIAVVVVSIVKKKSNE